MRSLISILKSVFDKAMGLYEVHNVGYLGLLFVRIMCNSLIEGGYRASG